MQNIEHQIAVIKDMTLYHKPNTKGWTARHVNKKTRTNQ